MVNGGKKLTGKTILITGAARRIGRLIALAAAKEGADIVVHHSQSPVQAEETAAAIRQEGSKAWVLQADFKNPSEVGGLIDRALKLSPLFALVNNAAIFEPLSLMETDLNSWDNHININLTAPFLLSQAFGKSKKGEEIGRIINLLDWRALRPGQDHFPYTISKAGLAALTQSLAQALAPNISVNGVALGAILPPSDGAGSEQALYQVPSARWAHNHELEDLLIFLLSGPSYITGEIIHLDGGRHLV